MDPTERRPLGRTGLMVTRLGLGGVPLGDPDMVTPEAQAEATVRGAYDAGVGYFDTSPWYGNGKSEHRMGHVLRTLPRQSFVISTKVGRVYFRPSDPDGFRHPRWAGGLPFDLRFDYTRDGVLRSYEDSLMRLGLNRVDVLFVHDLDFRHQKDEEGVRRALDQLDGGGWRALEGLRASGEIRGIGFGINHIGMIPRFLERFDADVFLVAMPYTLLDQPALDQEFPACAERGVAIVIGSVYAAGILATGPTDRAVYAYQPAPEEVKDRVRRITAVCDRHQVPLKAAALQFPLHHPVVAAAIPGALTPEQVRENLSLMQVEIPRDFWAELKRSGLLRRDAPTP